MLTNVRMPTIVGILTIVSMIHFMLSRVEHEKCFINLGVVLTELELFGVGLEHEKCFINLGVVLTELELFGVGL